MSFPNVVQYQPAPAVAGDFASSNPRAVVLAGPGGLVAGTGGVNTGLFAWADVNGLVTNAGSGVPTGFVHREQQALIVTYLAEYGTNVPVGFMVTLHATGDFWVNTTTVATQGQKVFASNTTGVIATGATGATIAGFTETKYFVETAGAVGELIKMSSRS